LVLRACDESQINAPVRGVWCSWVAGWHQLFASRSLRRPRHRLPRARQPVSHFQPRPYHDTTWEPV